MAAEQNIFKIYSFTLGQHGETVNNNDFYKHFNPYENLNNDEVFKEVTLSFVGYFDKGFTTNAKGNRAVAIAKDLVQAKGQHGIIHGFVKGGGNWN